MIIVTGGAGFIGSNLIIALNRAGHDDIVAVDDLRNGHKFSNLLDCRLADYLDKEELASLVENDDERLRGVRVIFHQGACSRTTEWDGRYMLENNYTFSKAMLAFARSKRIPFIYASSAAVYHGRGRFRERPQDERPVNVYGYSKLLFDQYVRRELAVTKSQIVGLRYFNVYGPREAHKGSMASVAYHFDAHLREGNTVRLFEGSGGYNAGEQRRDFVHVDDVTAVNLWFLEHSDVSGIFNVGTGRSQTFNDVARAVMGFHGHGEIEYIPFPESLRAHYQSYTQADLSQLRAAGYEAGFRSVEEGVPAYLMWLHEGEW